MVNFYIDNNCLDISGFESGHRVFDSYLRFQDDKAVLHYIMEANSDELITYFSLVASALLDGEISNLKVIPAIELKMFAVDKRYQGIGITPYLLSAVIEMIEHCAVEYIGAELIVLYSVRYSEPMNISQARFLSDSCFIEEFSTKNSPQADTE